LLHFSSISLLPCSNSLRLTTFPHDLKVGVGWSIFVHEKQTVTIAKYFVQGLIFPH
jgi:hypothetical protein